MSFGMVINGKLAVRDGRLACDCCGDTVDPGPSGGCFPCIVGAPGGLFRTTHFGGCVNPNTPDDIPPLVPGDSVAHQPENYPESGWNAPVVTVSGSWELNDTRVRDSNGSLLSGFNRTGTVDSLPTVTRNAVCNNWDFGASGPSGGIEWENTNLLNGQVSSGTGSIYSSGNQNGSDNLNPSLCGETGSAIGDPYNFELRVRFAIPGLSSIFDLEMFASTSDLYDETLLPNPCFGTGGAAFFASPNGNNGTLRGSFSMTGTCATKTLTWSGAYEESWQDSFSTTTRSWSWNITATIAGMVECPTELIV